MWTVQVHYDARYEADDLCHRLFKLLQLAAFTAVGAAAAGWDVYSLLSPRALHIHGDTLAHTKLRVSHCTRIHSDPAVRAGEAFTAVAATFAAYRLLLIIQYLFGE